MSSPLLFRIVLVLAFSFAGIGPAAAEERFPTDSPEHQALTKAGPTLGDEAFTLREDYWKGSVTSGTGRAVRLQFFKRNHYHLYFGVAPAKLPKNGSLHLHILDANNAEVASAAGETGIPVVEVEFKNTLKSGLYLILMRIEDPAGPSDAEVPAALFYGWK